MGRLKGVGEDKMAAATAGLKRETGFTVAEERQRWNRGAIARGRGADRRPAEDVPAGRKNVSTRNGQEILFVVMEGRWPQLAK